MWVLHTHMEFLAAGEGLRAGQWVQGVTHWGTYLPTLQRASNTSVVAKFHSLYLKLHLPF